MRIAFFGSAAFALPTLTALAAEPSYQLVAVVCQPDKPAGRGRQLTAPPIAAYARANGLPLLQPETLSNPEFQDTIRRAEPDLLVVVAYGKFLPSVLWANVPHGAINLHPSLLPKYRGAAPIQWSILNGDQLTGVSSLYVTEAMDAGDVLLQWPVPIRRMESAQSLHDRLARIGADLMLATIDGLAAHALTPQPQDSRTVVLAPKLEKESGKIDWQHSSMQIINQIRALQPWPGTYTMWDGKLLKICWAESPANQEVPPNTLPGTILDITRSIHIATGSGRLCLTELQLEGGKRMRSDEFLRGQSLTPGARFL